MRPALRGAAKRAPSTPRQLTASRKGAISANLGEAIVESGQPTMRIVVISAVALIAIYWGLVIVMRSFGTELPDPANLLPYSWRPYR
jgi:hypothetical protein